MGVAISSSSEPGVPAFCLEPMRFRYVFAGPFFTSFFLRARSFRNPLGPFESFRKWKKSIRNPHGYRVVISDFESFRIVRRAQLSCQNIEALRILAAIRYKLSKVMGKCLCLGPKFRNFRGQWIFPYQNVDWAGTMRFHQVGTSKSYKLLYQWKIPNFEKI